MNAEDLKRKYRTVFDKKKPAHFRLYEYEAYWRGRNHKGCTFPAYVKYAVLTIGRFYDPNPHKMPPMFLN